MWYRRLQNLSFYVYTRVSSGTNHTICSWKDVSLSEQSNSNHLKCKIANNKIKCNKAVKWSIWLQNIPKVYLLLTKWNTNSFIGSSYSNWLAYCLHCWRSNIFFFIFQQTLWVSNFTYRRLLHFLYFCCFCCELSSKMNAAA